MRDELAARRVMASGEIQLASIERITAGGSTKNAVLNAHMADGQIDGGHEDLQPNFVASQLGYWAT